MVAGSTKSTQKMAAGLKMMMATDIGNQSFSWRRNDLHDLFQYQCNHLGLIPFNKDMIGFSPLLFFSPGRHDDFSYLSLSKREVYDVPTPWNGVSFVIGPTQYSLLQMWKSRALLMYHDRLYFSQDIVHRQFSGNKHFLIYLPEELTGCCSRNLYEAAGTNVY